jgi:hypothetical protein
MLLTVRVCGLSCVQPGVTKASVISRAPFRRATAGIVTRARSQKAPKDEAHSIPELYLAREIAGLLAW